MNIFRPRVNIPIHEVPGGYQPWNNRQAPKRQSWTPWLFGALIMMGCCGTFAGSMISAVNFFNRDDPTPTLSLDEIVVSTFIGDTHTPAPLTATQVSSPTPATHTPTFTWTPTATETQAFVVRTQQPPPQPTQTPWVVVTHEVVRVTVPPVTIRQSVQVTSPPVIRIIEVTVPPVVITSPPEVITVAPEWETPTPTVTSQPPPTMYDVSPIELLPPTGES